MLFLVEEMQNYTHAWPFLEPVNIDEVTDYYDIIKDPMGIKKHRLSFKIANLYVYCLFRFGYVRRKCKS